MGSSAPFGLVKWITVPLSLKRLTSSMAGMLFTPSLFSVFCSLLSSVVVVLWMAFFFRRTEPLPPVRTWEAIFASFSGFMAASSGGPHEQSARVAWHVRVGQRVCSSRCVEDGRSLGGLPVRFSRRLKAAWVVARGAGRAHLRATRQTTFATCAEGKIVLGGDNAANVKFCSLIVESHCITFQCHTKRALGFEANERLAQT